MIKIQEKNFNLEDEINLVKSQYSDIGAISTFIGYVRNLNNQQKVIAIDLEVYKKMAYKSLEMIALRKGKVCFLGI